MDLTNQNITGAQRELLLWYWCLGHMCFQWLQALTRERHDIPAHILTKAVETRDCIALLCVACQLANRLSVITPPLPHKIVYCLHAILILLMYFLEAG